MSDNLSQRLVEFNDDELVEELMNRFDDILIGARKALDSKQMFRRRWWKGDCDACIGLMISASSDCVNKVWGIREDDIQY